jgi:NAD(P)-dependent dehydrogenase (short-subunit alcohol dehydrogenase family)
VNAGVEAFGRLDGLVNNAGSLRSGDLADLQEQDLDALMRVHLKGSFARTIHALRHRKARWDAGDDPRASVVNTFYDAVVISFPVAASPAARRGRPVTSCSHPTAVVVSKRALALRPGAVRLNLGVAAFELEFLSSSTVGTLAAVFGDRLTEIVDLPPWAGTGTDPA